MAKRKIAKKKTSSQKRAGARLKATLPRVKVEPPWTDKFLAYYRKRYSIKSAARFAGVTPATVYKHRRENKDFAKLMIESHDEVVDKLENSAMRRAIHGYNQPVFHRGKLVGTQRKFCDALTIFMLKKNRPGKYDDKLNTQLDPEEYARRLKDAINGANSLVPSSPDQKPIKRRKKKGLMAHV